MRDWMHYKKSLAQGGLGNKRRIAVLLVIVLAILLTFALRSAVPPQTINIVNGVANPLLAQVSNPTIGYTDNLQNWNSSTGGLVTTSEGLSFTQSIMPSSNTTQFLISKETNVDIQEYPIVDLKIAATPGVQFGVLFKGLLSNGTEIELGANRAMDGISSGNGSFQELRSDLIAENSNLTFITGVYIYVQAAPSNRVTTFKLQLQSLEFLNYPLEQISSTSQYQDVYLTFKNNLLNSTWYLNHINLGATIDATQGTTFVIYIYEDGTLYNVGRYALTPSIATYEYTLVPQNETTFFPAMLTGNNITIILSTTQGSIHSVNLEYVTFISLPPVQENILVQPQDYRGLYVYVIFFLFLLPAFVVAIFYDKFRSGKLNPNHILLAGLAGVIVRLALAPITSQPYDTLVYATSDRAWFQFGSLNSSLGPTLPFTFFLYHIPYSFYALLEILGLHDIYFTHAQVGIFAHSQMGMIEAIFVKAFPMISDFFVFYLFLKMQSWNKYATLFAVFYLLNPLTIYVSAIWGQYEAAASALLILGFYFQQRNNTYAGKFLSSLSVVTSALVELFSFIPFFYMLINEIRSKRIIYALLFLSPLLLFLVYEPEFRLTYLVLLSAFGAVPAIGFSNASEYSIFSYIPNLSLIHPLATSLSIIAIAYVVYAKYDNGHVALFTIGSFLAIILFGAQLVQWWALIPPLALFAALITKKHDLGVYIYPFGAMIAFVAISYTQKVGLMTINIEVSSLMPFIEQVNNTLFLYTSTSAIAAFLLIYYMVRPSSESSHTLRNTSLVLSGVFVAEFIIFGIL
jgi:hypothetical protein